MRHETAKKLALVGALPPFFNYAPSADFFGPVVLKDHHRPKPEYIGPHCRLEDRAEILAARARIQAAQDRQGRKRARREAERAKNPPRR